MAQLNTDQQIQKLEEAMRMAERASASSDVPTRLGALVLYAGIVDFLAIQAARLVERLVLKGQLADGKTPLFKPNEDSFFYNRKISTGRILVGIRKFLPFTAPSADISADAAHITKLAETMVADAFRFLDCRNPLLHQIGNPARTFTEVLVMADQAIAAYHAFRESHKAFFEAAAPYRFGPRELDYFYGQG